MGLLCKRKGRRKDTPHQQERLVKERFAKEGRGGARGTRQSGCILCPLDGVVRDRGNQKTSLKGCNCKNSTSSAACHSSDIKCGTIQDPIPSYVHHPLVLMQLLD